VWRGRGVDPRIRGIFAPVFSNYQGCSRSMKLPKLAFKRSESS
jgi:hypothetical protein